MTDVSAEPDPWQNRHTDLPAGGPDFGRLVTAMRRLQDTVAMIAPPEEFAGAAAEDIERLAASLEKWQVGEWERYAGRRRDLPGRGHPLLLPFTVDESTDTSVRGRVVFGPYSPRRQRGRARRHACPCFSTRCWASWSARTNRRRRRAPPT